MLPSEIQGKRILYTVLNWGLGHAARSIPLIRQLQYQGNDIHLASDGLALKLLQSELPSFKIHELPELNIHYNRKSMAFNMLSQLPHLLNHFRLDVKAVNVLQREMDADIIISDHRYGGLHKECHNIFLAHQLSILKPDYNYHKIASLANARAINRFDDVWVPDYAEQHISGKLSTNSLIKKPIQFIGPLSRFQAKENKTKLYDLLAVLSGPEPKRTELERLIIEQMKNAKGRFAIVGGVDKTDVADIPNIDFFGIESTDGLQKLFNQSKYFIGRAGYSTIMDLLVLNLPSVLIPTPGQTEQLYLSQHLSSSQFQFCVQETLQLKSMLGLSSF